MTMVLAETIVAVVVGKSVSSLFVNNLTIIKLQLTYLNYRQLYSSLLSGWHPITTEYNLF